MDLLSLNYLVFVLASVAAFQILPARWRPALLSVVSVIFFSLFSPISALVMVGLTFVTYEAAITIETHRGSRTATAVLWVIVLAEIAYLAFFKAVPMIGIQVRSGAVGRFVAGFGVSYYTFKLLSYLIDVYWGRQITVRDFSLLLAAVSFFPQLPAGPIQRVNEFQLPRAGDQVPELMRFGLRRILLGLAKKLLIADSLGGIVALIAGNAHDFQHQLWILFYLYPLQLYADFAALTDLAVGIAALFGIKSPENFHFPFFASTISEYWRGWHMTLTRWLTDYVFTPLRMAMRSLGSVGLVISLTLNMVLIGLWHGFNWGFLIFGLIHAVFLSVDALTRSYREDFYDRHPALDRMSKVYARVVTFHLVAFALVWFRNPTVFESLYQLQHFFSGLAHPIVSLSGLMYHYGRLHSLIAFCGLGLLIGIETAGLLRESSLGAWRKMPSFSALPGVVRWACYYAVIVVIVVLHRQATQFIYVQF
jgi:alginate O-acetyltransferase complex protein AlgI